MWFSVYEIATGRLVSVGTEVSPNLPNDEMGVVGTEDQPDVALWDEGAFNYKPREAGAEAGAEAEEESEDESEVQPPDAISASPPDDEAAAAVPARRRWK